MVYGFVQQSGGSIAADSVPGQGTSITITLPASTGGRIGLSDLLRTSDPCHLHGGGRAVLVVEDDADVRHIAVSTLQSLAFHVMDARSGDEALAILEQTPEIKFVFSDVNMPGTMTGLELGHKVRNRWPDVPVLLTSGYLREDQDVGGFEVLHKPYRASELIEKLCKFLSDDEPFAATKTTNPGIGLVSAASDFRRD
jgi:CheY-like chemotaxis protein